jgi:hypothetical protein
VTVYGSNQFALFSAILFLMRVSLFGNSWCRLFILSRSSACIAYGSFVLTINQPVPINLIYFENESSSIIPKGLVIEK